VFQQFFLVISDAWYSALPIFQVSWQIIKTWGWVIVPFLLVRPFLFLWLWWRGEKWWADPAQKMALLEIKIPKEVIKPLKAMEQVFNGLWGAIYDPADWWEKWIEGKMLTSIGLEIVSLGGEIHFFIRVLESRRNEVESTIYSQFPDAEISIVDDYTKNVPQNIPNKDWTLWGSDYCLEKPDVYPIKTYSKFFEVDPNTKEEKRIDPLTVLLEGMADLKAGEQLWVQILAGPITTEEYNYIARGKEVVSDLIKRPKPKKPKSMIREIGEAMVSGVPPGAKKEEKKEELIPPEMKLTPGEREIVAGIEEKIGKHMFMCSVRFVYLGKGEAYTRSRKAIPFAFFNQFATQNLNNIKPWSKTITKVHLHERFPFNLIFEKRLKYIKCRRMFKAYVMRVPPLWPANPQKGKFALNTEELASIFHFPSREVAPAPFFPRVEAKKGEAPRGLPME